MDPHPARDGQRVYSGGLIAAAASAAGRLEVLCFESDAPDGGGAAVPDAVRWWRVPHRPNPAWASLVSPLPNVAFRCDTGPMRERLARLLDAKRWDAIFFDGLYAGFGLDLYLHRFQGRKDRPRLVYVSHNHEETVRSQMARNADGAGLKRWALRRDARKAARLERAMVDAADIVTAITPDDAAQFAARRSGKPVVVLPPGYSGPRRERRRITSETPRRAIALGTFDWLAKRMNLREFLAAADSLFARSGAHLQIIGNGDTAFLDEMRRRYTNTSLVGGVESVSPYLDEARIAIVPERTGGGFKIKTLDYVFHRVPIAALENSVAGMPLSADDSILTYPSYERLARGVLEAIDDLDLLNRLQERAYRACSESFCWEGRGAELLSAVAAS